MHHVGVMLAGKNIAGAAHIGGELIDFVEAAVDDSAAKALISQIADHEIIGFSLGKFLKFQVHAAHPEPVML